MDSIPHPSTRHASPPPRQKEEDNDARFIAIMEQMTERVVYHSTPRLANEVARLGRELQKANETITTLLKHLIANDNKAANTN